MKKIFIPAIAILLTALSTGYTLDRQLVSQPEVKSVQTHKPVVSTPEMSPFTRTELLEGINKLRASEGKSPLTINARLNESAQLKANDMTKNHYWAHISPDGTEPWAWFDKANYDYGVAGENLAKCYKKSDNAIKAWWNSPGHKANMLGEFEETGFGFAQYETDCVVIVQHFGTPQSNEN